MKLAMIAPVGMSPPVVTELMEWLMSREIYDLTDVVLIVSNDDDVRRSAEFIKTAVKVNYPRIRVHEKCLPFRDISSLDDNLEFMRVCASAINEEKVKFRCDGIFLNVAGGRKDMSISLSFLGQFVGVSGVFHVIHPEVRECSMRDWRGSGMRL